MQKLTHIVYIVKELITQRTFAGMAQMRLTDLKDTKMKVLITQQTTVINQEVHTKCSDIYFEESFKLKKPRLDW